MITTHVRYGSNRLRYLLCDLHSSVVMELRWKNKVSGPSVLIRWSDPNDLRGPGVRVWVAPKPVALSRPIYTVRTYMRDYGTIGFPNWESYTYPLDFPEPWLRILSLARSVAAGRAPGVAILGYIEDCFFEPWTALATNPLETLKCLCNAVNYSLG